MNDKNNDNSADLKANLDKIANTKPRKRSSKDNIYERFINRVDSTDEDNHTATKSDKLTSWEKTQKSPTYEPLSAEELTLFANLENDQELNSEASNTTSTNISFDFTNKEEVFSNNSNPSVPNSDQPSNKNLLNGYNLDEDSNLERDSKHTEHTENMTDLTATDDEVATKEIAKPQGMLASNKKPLIIGIILGTLLAAIVMFILNTSGILSPSTESIFSDTSQNVANGVKEKSNSSVQSNNSPVVKTESAAANNTNQNSTSQKNVAANGDNNTPSNVNGDTAKPENATADGLDAESDITYEDFREESQSTLYRETDD